MNHKIFRYNIDPHKKENIDGKDIFFFKSYSDNIDVKTKNSFGEEWTKFNSFNPEEIEKIGDEYFDIVPSHILNSEQTQALDLGCGTGRWSIYLSDKVKNIEAIDPSDAIFAAAHLCKDYDNINLSQASADTIPFDNNTFDFAMSLGVLHHIPDTQKALNDLVSKVKKGGHVLIYLYYALDNRSFLYKAIFKISSVFRNIISRLPSFFKKIICDLIAIFIYLPLITLSYFVLLIFGKQGSQKIPLSYYIGKSFNVIRNDALDRFGTPLEKRFAKSEVENMMKLAGLTNIVFSPNMPCWHAIGKKSD